MSIKALLKDCWIVFVAIMLGLIVFSLFPSIAYASEAVSEVVDNSVPLFEILSLLVGGEKAAQWLGMIGFVAYLLTQSIPWIPATWLDKLPNWLLTGLHYIAGNYRGTKNELSSTVKRIT